MPQYAPEAPGLAGTAPRLAPRTTVATLVALAACGDGAIEPHPDPDPPAVAAIDVTSPIDTLLAVGWTTQLEATARNAAGGTMGASFTWQSSDSDVASVEGTGQVLPVSAGTALISATAAGVTGSLRIRVLAADVEAATAVLADPLVDHLVGGLGAGEVVQAALAGCGSALDAGNLAAAGGCVETLRAAAADATDPDDRALLAVLLLLSDHAARLIVL